MKMYLCAGVLSIATLFSAAASDERIRLGTLDCVIAGGSGSGFGSVKDLKCEFTPLSGGPVEPYFGVVERFGVDIGTTTIVGSLLSLKG